MVLEKNIIFALIFISCCFFCSSNLTAVSNQAVVPLNITVLGKLVITDANNDNKSGLNPNLNIFLKVMPDINSSIVSGSSAIRIRTNLNTWKLTAQRSDANNRQINIDPKDIVLNFSTQAGASANPYSGKLLSPFDRPTDLGQISTNAPTDLLIGNRKTSLQRDPDNKNNWFQITSNYSISPDFLYEPGEWNTTVSYSLVSP